MTSVCLLWSLGSSLEFGFVVSFVTSDVQFVNYTNIWSRWIDSRVQYINCRLLLSHSY